DRYNHLVADRDRPEMRCSVVLAGAAIVPIPLRVPGCDGPLEPLENVLPQPRLMIVHEDGRGDMHRGGEHHPLLDSGGGSTLVHRVGDVDDLLALFRLESEVVGMRLHSRWQPWSKGGWVCAQSVCFDPKLLSRAFRMERL